MTQIQGPWLLKQLSGSVLSCPRSSLLALNRNISLRFPGDWWQQGSWSDDNMTKPRKSLPRTWCCLAPSSSLSSQFCLYFVSSYLATQFLGRILSWPAPFSNVDVQIISLTHSKHSILNTPEWTHSSNIKKVLPAIFYPLMPWWDELPSVSNFLPPPDTKLCEYRPELVIISIFFSSLFTSGQHRFTPLFHKRKSARLIPRGDQTKFTFPICIAAKFKFSCGLK